MIKMATSILGYIFRELAISYLNRGDLAHVQPGDLLPDAVGKAEAESTFGDPGDDDRPEVALSTSSGYVRSKLTVVRDGAVGAFGDKAVDMTLRLENTRALPTCPQRQQLQQTALIAA